MACIWSDATRTPSPTLASFYPGDNCHGVAPHPPLTGVGYRLLGTSGLSRKRFLGSHPVRHIGAHALLLPGAFRSGKIGSSAPQAASLLDSGAMISPAPL